MKKLVLIIGLVIVVIGVMVGGAMAVSALNAPSLKVTGNTGATPATLIFAGKNWNAGTVALYMDVEDAAHQVANAAVASNGSFNKTVSIGTATLGVHQMLAVQGLNNASASFTITSRPPTDPVVADILSEIDDETYGLEEIKIEVADIQDKVNSEVYGLEETKNEIIDIQTDVTSIIDRLSNVPVMATATGTFNITDDGYGQQMYSAEYDEMRHVSLTISYNGLNAPKHGIYVLANVNGDLKVIAAWAFNLSSPVEEAYTIDFNTDAWEIGGFKSGDPEIQVWYNATMTYVPAPPGSP